MIDGAAEYDRALPMMMTAAGTVKAARVLVLGAGVAIFGLMRPALGFSAVLFGLR